MMPSPNGGNVNNLEEECVLSLLALQKQERSVTPEQNANTGTAKPTTAEPSPLPAAAASEPAIPKKPVETLQVTQAPLEIPNPTRQGETAANGTVMSVPPQRSTTKLPSVPYQTATCTRLVAPPRQVPLLPSNMMMNEFWSSTQATPQHGALKPATKRKRNDFSLVKKSLVPILPNGWDQDRDFDDMAPDAPLLPHYPHIGIEEMIGGSPLVKKQDRNLVPDALFVAMAQLEPCRLEVADKTGSYRKLELGFVGFCCKHCGGQPGFGRYFPSTMRSCAQTTSSQTIIKHIDSKCRYVPDTIRSVVLELERIHQQKEINNELGRPRYGARKVFFERVWKRLHDYKFSNQAEQQVTIQSISGEPLAATELETCKKEQEKDDDDDTNKEQSAADSTRENKFRFGRLPTKKNVQNRMKGLDGSNNKRARVST